MNLVENKTLKRDWINIFFLTLTPVFSIGLCSIYFSKNGFELSQVLLAILFYFISGISITAGYHRLFSHRTYHANSFIKFLFLFFGAGAFQNSALLWCTDHRVHHNHVDEEKDPYNINKGFFYAHIGWIFYQDANPNPKFPKDLSNDKLIMWQHKNYLWLCLLSGFLLPTLVGYFLGSALGGFALAGVTRVVFVHHCTFFINSLCHIIGTRPYTDTNTARDSALMAIFSYGEGYHNYHHYFPTDYRNGVKWYHFDPTKWLIKTLSFFGQTSHLKFVPNKLIERAKDEMIMKLKSANSLSR